MKVDNIHKKRELIGKHTRTNINDFFKSYKPEQKMEVRPLIVTKNQDIMRTSIEYMRINKMKSYIHPTPNDIYFSDDLIRNTIINCSPEDVTNFSLALAGVQDDDPNFSFKAGSFISDLIRHCKAIINWERRV